MSSASTSQPIVPKTNYIEEKEDREAYRKIDVEICREMLPNLPKEKGWISEHLVQYKGVWLNPTFALKAAVQLQHHFNLFQTTGSSTSAAGGSSPICFLASFPKSGTTWLRALMFATLNRSLYDAASPHHPLLTTGPHDCFPFLDMDDMLGNHDHNRPVTSLDHDHDDRDGGDGMINNHVPPTSTTQLFATHLPYSLLPKSVTTSSSTCSVSKFVYVYRNPKDVFISSWIFASKVRAINTRLAPFSLEEAFEIFCRGVCPYGPYWDHVLGFWKASLEMPEQVWFLKYEDLKKEPSANVKRLAEFLGQPFSEEEESKGVVQQIIKLCSFENLSSLEVNKTSRTQQYFVKANIVFENSDFFRKGQVGDWKNFFTDDMAKCMDQIVDERFSGSGLTFANPTSTKTCLRDADNFVAQSMFARRDAQDVAQVVFARRNFARRRYASRKVTTCATSCASRKTCTSRKSLAPNHTCFTVFSTFARRLASSRKVNAKIYIFIFLSSVLIQVKSSIAAFPSSSPANLHSRLITFFGIILFSFVRG